MTTPTSPPRRPAGRYDEPQPLSRRTLIVGSVLLVGVLAVFSVVAFRYYSGNHTQYATTGYDVTSDHAVEVRFEVVKERGDTVECQLQARDRLNAEVGSLLVRVGPDLTGTVSQTATIPTSARAAAGEVLNCRLAP